MATSREVAAKLGLANGSKSPQEIASNINQGTGTPLNIGRTKTPLSESGSTLPPVKKGK